MQQGVPTTVPLCMTQEQAFAKYPIFDTSLVDLPYTISNSVNAKALVYKSKDQVQFRDLFVKSPANINSDPLFIEAYVMYTLMCQMMLPSTVFTKHFLSMSRTKILECHAYFMGNISYKDPQTKSQWVLSNTATTVDQKPCLMTNAISNPVSLSKYLKQNEKKLSPEAVVNIILKVYGAMAKHAQFIHNDLHAGNILIDENTTNNTMTSNTFAIIDYGRAFIYPKAPISANINRWDDFKACSNQYYSNVNDSDYLSYIHKQRKYNKVPLLKGVVDKQRLWFAFNLDVAGLAWYLFFKYSYFDQFVNELNHDIRAKGRPSTAQFTVQELKDLSPYNSLFREFKLAATDEELVIKYLEKYKFFTALSQFKNHIKGLNPEQREAYATKAFELLCIQRSNEILTQSFKAKLTLARDPLLNVYKRNRDTRPMFAALSIGLICYNLIMEEQQILDYIDDDIHDVMTRSAHGLTPFDTIVKKLTAMPFIGSYPSVCAFMYSSGQIHTNWYEAILDAYELDQILYGGKQDDEIPNSPNIKNQKYD